jgi:hypothetical protein
MPSYGGVHSAGPSLGCHLFGPLLGNQKNLMEKFRQEEKSKIKILLKK